MKTRLKRCSRRVKPPPSWPYVTGGAFHVAINRPQGRRCEFFIICVYLCNICERVSKNRDVTMDTFRPVKIFVFQKDRNDFCENWRSYFRGILIVQYSCLFVMTCWYNKQVILTFRIWHCLNSYKNLLCLVYTECLFYEGIS